jgi:hypothetical protein
MPDTRRTSFDVVKLAEVVCVSSADLAMPVSSLSGCDTISLAVLCGLAFALALRLA